MITASLAEIFNFELDAARSRDVENCTEAALRDLSVVPAAVFWSAPAPYRIPPDLERARNLQVAA